MIGYSSAEDKSFWQTIAVAGRFGWSLCAWWWWWWYNSV